MRTIKSEFAMQTSALSTEEVYTMPITYDSNGPTKKTDGPKMYKKKEIILSASSYYLCDVCQKGFSGIKQLERHREIHSLSRPFPCALCDKRFLSRSHHFEHQRIHTGERPFQCNRCDRRFSTKHNMTRHMNVHAKEDTYRCEICGLMYCDQPDHIMFGQPPKSEPQHELKHSPSSSPPAITPSSSGAQILTASSSLSGSTPEDLAPPPAGVSTHVHVPPAPNPSRSPRLRGRPPASSTCVSRTHTRPSDPEKSSSGTSAPSVQGPRVPSKKENPSSPHAGISRPVEIPITLTSIFFDVTTNHRCTRGKANELWLKSNNVKIEEKNIEKDEISERASLQAVAYDIEFIL